jgi:molybdopterin-guanine dinucleotide biosynthesis protein A
MSMSLIVQAGGNSSRMGQDKARMLFLKEPLIARVLRRLSGVADEVFVTMNTQSDYSFLGVPLVVDVYPEKGALGGLYTGLLAATFPVAAVVACDLPFINPLLLKKEFELMVQSGADAVVPASPKGLEPLHSVFRREVCLRAVEEAVKAGQYRVTSWFPKINLRIMSVDEVLAWDPYLRSFINVNAPEEFIQAEALAQEMGEGLPPE